MKRFHKSIIFLFINFLVLKALAHEHDINISQQVTECKDNKDPIYVLDEESLGGVGHGNHNYITICPEDIPQYQHEQKVKRSQKMKRSQRTKRSRKPKFNFLDGERHNFEYEKPVIDDIFDKSSLNLSSYINKNTINTGEFEFNEEEETVSNVYSAFKIEFYCSETPNLCEKAKSSFEKATQKIAIALKIKTPIIVQASLYSFCKSKGGSYCSSKSSSIGSAAASAYHILNNNGTKYLYPQPLVKQMDDMGIYLTTDITSDFNSDYSFYFSGDNQIEDGQIDFEYVVIHELIHGLGFATAFQKYFSLVAKVIDDQDFLSPGLSLINNTYVSSWRSIQIFDKNIVSTKDNKPLNSYNNDIMKFTTTSRLLSPLEYHNEFIRSQAPYQAAKHILNVASNKTGSLVFKTSEGEDIVLYTKDNEFLQGTSIAHLADSYKYSSDFIMISDVSPLQGKTLSQMYYEFGDNNPYGALGPNVLKILKEIGWEIASEPTNIGKFYINNEMIETSDSSSILKYILPKSE
ncbi:hypothetical protein BCR32DRAFT_286159 [Anaeromyces robustus]|uniref:Sequence orphan n=1 Tax=Anaeromyces robustus TaxID=1754192 RepID=A0A1Y1W4C5_9FUNG|nr:hypothetical protein BCR32DRAFT_286159 [Anaeromyces robustus]|eukprot:ORX68086.1 hypothetical protein BCR32DRAFT_286159 [Anaeromyces robustus]